MLRVQYFSSDRNEFRMMHRHLLYPQTLSCQIFRKPQLLLQGLTLINLELFDIQQKNHSVTLIVYSLQLLHALKEFVFPINRHGIVETKIRLDPPMHPC